MLTLRRLRTNELHAGMTLPSDIYDRDENLIMSRGDRLTASALQLMPKPVYTDESWPSRRRAASVADEVFQRLGVNQPTACQRRHSRRTWTTSIQVVIHQRTHDFAMCQETTVATLDLSRGGFSFLYRQYVPIDTIVEARFDMLPDHPVVKGVVVNCRLIGGMNHRVGVAFKDDG